MVNSLYTKAVLVLTRGGGFLVLSAKSESPQQDFCSGPQEGEV